MLTFDVNSRFFLISTAANPPQNYQMNDSDSGSKCTIVFLEKSVAEEWIIERAVNDKVFGVRPIKNWNELTDFLKYFQQNGYTHVGIKTRGCDVQVFDIREFIANLEKLG